MDPYAYAKIIEMLEASLKNSSSPAYGFAGARLKAGQDILQRRLILETVREKRRMIPCYAGKLTLVLTESGALYPCESFSMNMGNVRSYDCNVQKLLESREAKKGVAAIRQSACYCTHECYMMMNILFNPRLYPTLIKEYIRLVLSCIPKIDSVTLVRKRLYPKNTPSTSLTKPEVSKYN